MQELNINPLINVDISLYFEVLDAELYGGKGTVGYTAVKYGGFRIIKTFENDVFVRDHINKIADMCSVPSENVRLISKAEYEEATSEDEDTDEDYWYDDV